MTKPRYPATYRFINEEQEECALSVFTYSMVAIEPDGKQRDQVAELICELERYTPTWAREKYGLSVQVNQAIQWLKGRS